MHDLGAGNRLTIAPGVSLEGRALRWHFSRSGGPGGQNVNKLNTRCTLVVDAAALAEVLPPDATLRLWTLAGSRLASNPARLVFTAAAGRSQLANRQACLAKLSELVASAMRRPKTRRATRPTVASRRLRLDAKRRRGAIKAARHADGRDG